MKPEEKADWNLNALVVDSCESWLESAQGVLRGVVCIIALACVLFLPHSAPFGYPNRYGFQEEICCAFSEGCFGNKA